MPYNLPTVTQPWGIRDGSLLSYGSSSWPLCLYSGHPGGIMITGRSSVSLVAPATILLHFYFQLRVPHRFTSKLTTQELAPREACRWGRPTSHTLLGCPWNVGPLSATTPFDLEVHSYMSMTPSFQKASKLERGIDKCGWSGREIEV